MPNDTETTMPEYVELQWEDFTEQFKPQTNHLDDNASLDGLMFETYGKEFEFVQSIARETPERVWTYTDDGEDACLVSGFHYVNRLGYVVTELPATPNKYISVID